MICETCKKPQGSLRDDSQPRDDDDDYCWHAYNRHAPCEDPLVAAAPDLLAACEALLSVFGIEQEAPFAVEIARAAVKKARGK